MQSTTPKPIRVWDAPVVERFLAGTEDILVLDREPLEHLSGAIRAGRVHEYQAEVTAETARHRVAAGLRELAIDSEPFLSDVSGLVIAFLSHFVQTRAGLRIELVQTQSCPKFHCDNVSVRLITTYHGPTTEYRYVNDETVHVAPRYGLVFLKGYKHPTHQGSVLHRSPKVPNREKRLFVVLNI